MALNLTNHELSCHPFAIKHLYLLSQWKNFSLFGLPFGVSIRFFFFFFALVIGEQT